MFQRKPPATYCWSQTGPLIWLFVTLSGRVTSSKYPPRSPKLWQGGCDEDCLVISGCPVLIYPFTEPLDAQVGIVQCIHVSFESCPGNVGATEFRTFILIFIFQQSVLVEFKYPFTPMNDKEHAHLSVTPRSKHSSFTLTHPPPPPPPQAWQISQFGWEMTSNGGQFSTLTSYFECELLTLH